MKKDIGEMMLERRLELGLSLEDVAKAVGVGKSTVRKWEVGIIKNMGRDKIAALARVLEMSPAAFVPGDAHEAPAEESEEVRILTRGMDKMTPDQKKQLLDLVRVAFRGYFDDKEGS